MFFESSSSTFCAEFATWFSLSSTILELNIGTFKQLPRKFIMSSIEWSWNLCLPSTDLFKCVTDMQLHSVDDSVGKSRHILGSMNQRMSQHKWIIVTVIAVLVLAIALIVYVKMHSKRSWCSFCSLSLCQYVVYLGLLNRSRNQVNWDRLNSCAELALQVYNSWRPVSQHHLDKSWHSTWSTQLHNLGGFMILSCSTLNHIWVLLQSTLLLLLCPSYAMNNEKHQLRSSSCLCSLQLP